MYMYHCTCEHVYTCTIVPVNMCIHVHVVHVHVRVHVTETAFTTVLVSVLLAGMTTSSLNMYTCAHTCTHTHTHMRHHQAKRQQRKLNFLITQTELYAHFMAKKLTGEEDLSGEILKKLDDAPLQREVQPGVVVDLETPGDYDSQVMKAKALANVEAALVKQDVSVRQLGTSMFRS